MTKPNGASSDGPTIQAIETVYRGHRMRSRLEARWAVFMDCLGIEWEYEKEGYDLGGVWYLPDFWLPKHDMWVEVKGQDTGDWQIKAERLAAATGKTVAVFIGACEPPGWDEAHNSQNWAAVHHEGHWQSYLGPTAKPSFDFGWLNCVECGASWVYNNPNCRCKSRHLTSSEYRTVSILAAHAITRFIRFDDRELLDSLTQGILAFWANNVARDLAGSLLDSDLAQDLSRSIAADSVDDAINDYGRRDARGWLLNG